MAFYWCGIFTIDQLITEGERPYFTDSRTIKVKWSLLPSMFNNIVGLLEPRFRLVSVALWWDIWMACYYFCYCWWWWMSSQPRTGQRRIVRSKWDPADVLFQSSGNSKEVLWRINGSSDVPILGWGLRSWFKWDPFLFSLWAVQYQKVWDEPVASCRPRRLPFGGLCSGTVVSSRLDVSVQWWVPLVVMQRLWCCYGVKKINIFFVWMLLQLCWVVEVSNEIWAPYNTIIQPCKSLCFERVKWKERIWSGLYVFERWVLVKASEEIEQRTVFSQSLLSITWIFPYTFIHSHKCHLQTFQKHIFIFSITKCIQLLNCLFSKSFENENKHDVMVGFVSEIYIVDGWRTMMLPWVFSAQ